MAELHVEPKKRSATPTWLWIVIALLIIGAVVYFLMRKNDSATLNNGSATNGNSTSYIMAPSFECAA